MEIFCNYPHTVESNAYTVSTRMPPFLDPDLQEPINVMFSSVFRYLGSTISAKKYFGPFWAQKWRHSGAQGITVWLHCKKIVAKCL